MKNKRLLKSILFVIALAVVCAIVFFLYYRITGKTNPLSNIFKNEETVALSDNYNGFYVYSEELDNSYNIYNGCVVRNIDYQILVMGDKFKLYKESCIGTYYMKSGNTEDLEFKEDPENKILYFEYEGNRYNKKNEITSVVLGNTFVKNTKKLDLSNYKFLAKQTEFEGNYFNMSNFDIDGASGFKFDLIHDEDDYFHIVIKAGMVNSVYTSTSSSDFDRLPDVYPYGKIVALVFPNKYGNDYKYNLLAFSKKQMVYSLYEKFPIEVNGYRLTSEDNFYISYQKNTRSFLLLVAPKDSTLKNVFCEDNKEGNEIAYYVFSMKYDYSKVSFEDPQYERVGYVKDGCSYVNELMGG